MTATEYVILVDGKDNATGTAEKLYAHQNNLLHRAFSIFIFRKMQGLEVLLQQRAAHKYHSSGLWTNTCCSHPKPDENILEAGQRRLFEELGFTTDLIDAGWFIYNAHFSNGLSEHELDHVLIGSMPPGIFIQPNPEEVQAWRWVNVEDLRKELETQSETFTAWVKEGLEKACRSYLP